MLQLLQLLSKIQRTKVESKSQHRLRFKGYALCCYQKYKELKLKANHNEFTAGLKESGVVIKNTKN